MNADALPIAAGILVVSDSVVAGTRTDRAGERLQELLFAAEAIVPFFEYVADEIADIQEMMRRAAHEGVELLLTTGGTGFAPRDVTPEATDQLLTRSAPGIAEAIRRASDASGRGFGMRSRGVAGIFEGMLIVNLPGSTNGAEEGWGVIQSEISHCISLMRGDHLH